MFRRYVSAFLASPLLIAVLAGCLEDTKTPDYHAAGTSGNFALGYAYDGKGVLAFDGHISIQADEIANTGDAVVGGTLNGKPWRVIFDRFAQQGNKSFQDGGVATNLMEHGDSKNGDTSLPTVHADLAAWGEASVTVDGKPLPDALTGDPLWVAHFMVITTGVRDDATKGIWNAAKTAPYDPSKPTDGLSTEGDNEIHLVLKSHATAAPAPIPIDNRSDPIHEPNFREIHRYPNAFQNSEFDVNITMTGGVAPQTSFTFTFLDTEGKQIKQVTLRQTLSGDPAPQAVHVPMNKTGTYSIDVSGNAVGATYEIKGQQSPPGNVVMNLWWEDVLFGAAAERFASEQTGEPMGSPTHSHPSSGSTAAPPVPRR